jgi:DNA uptake protein ComE-like DNA-binding protein
MEDPTAVTQWQPQPLPQDSLQAESQILKTHMQNLAGGQPFTSTSEANQINANTATEAALVTNLAQAAVKR